MRGKFVLLYLVVLLFTIDIVFGACNPPCDSDEFCEYNLFCSVNPACECGPNKGYGTCSSQECDGCTCEIPTCPGTWASCYWDGFACKQCGTSQYCTGTTCATLNCPGDPVPYHGECCPPTTCSSVECGSIEQGCGLGSVLCPDTCVYGYDCSPTGNSCVCDPIEQKAIYCEGKTCGSTTVCGGTPISCGTCDTTKGQICQSGTCYNSPPTVSITPTTASTTTGNTVTFYATIRDDNGITQVTATKVQYQRGALYLF